jgi:hypothetical protein
MPAVLFSANVLLLLTERTTLIRTTGCKEQPRKSRHNVRPFVINFIPGLEFVYRVTVRHVASVSYGNPASFFVVEMRREKKYCIDWQSLGHMGVVGENGLKPGPDQGPVTSCGLSVCPCPQIVPKRNASVCA